MNLIVPMPSGPDDVLTLGQEAQCERQSPAYAEAQDAPRPSLREINAAIRSLRIHALGREDYCVLLDGRVATRGESLARRLALRRRRRVIAAHRLPAWWSAVTTEPAHARDLLLIALFTGLLQSKVMTLRWDCVDLAGKVLYVPQTESGGWFGLPISDFLAELIGRRRTIVEWSDWVFPGRGRTGHIADTKSIVRRVAGRAAVPFALHDLRRTFITVAMSLDVQEYALKRLLNLRTDGDITAGYSVDDVEWLRDPVQRIADRILRLARPRERRNVVGFVRGG